jgi:hypothetical protein
LVKGQGFGAIAREDAEPEADAGDPSVLAGIVARGLDPVGGTAEVVGCRLPRASGKDRASMELHSKLNHMAYDACKP